MLLEVSEKGVRRIVVPEKATLMGMIASDGSNVLYRKERSKGRYCTEYTTRFYSKDKELIEMFDRLSEEIYDITPHHYTRKRNSLITAQIYSKGIFYDLDDLDLKPRPYEFHVPREHLDSEGKKAFLKGFFSGDGSISLSKGRITVMGIYSKYKEGLEELCQILTDVGFHPYEILEYQKPGEETCYYFLIPAKEYVKFMEEIGSYRPRHVLIFEEFKKKLEEREEK